MPAESSSVRRPRFRRRSSGHASAKGGSGGKDAEEKRQRRERVERGKEKAQNAARKTRLALAAVGAVIVGVALFLGGVLPFAFGALLTGASAIVVAFGVGMASLGTWMREHSDDRGERAVWLLVIVAAITAVLFAWGGI